MCKILSAVFNVLPLLFLSSGGIFQVYMLTGFLCDDERVLKQIL